MSEKQTIEEKRKERRKRTGEDFTNSGQESPHPFRVWG